jgi:LPXTG-motif cell wall-anchored protein
MIRSVVRLLSGVLLALALCGGVLAAPTHQATTWNVLVGGQSSDKAIQAQAFLPTKLTINAGDTVAWKLNAFVHTVSFLSGAQAPPPVVPDGNQVINNPVVDNPAGGPNYDGTGYANSGFMPVVAQNFSLTFTTPGTYGYVCLLHPGMAGEVVVQAAGSAYPLTQAQVDQQANAELYAKLAQGNQQLQSVQLKSQANADGTTNYTIVNGIGGNQSSVLRFLPVDVTVKAGDSIAFPVQDPHEIHTVTFYDPAGQVPPFVVPQEQTGGPPKQVVIHAAPQGGAVVKDNGLYNSGILLPGQSYSFSFPNPGTYTYVCVVHSTEGMFGKVTVAAGGAGTPAQLPNTGGETATLLLLGGGLLLLLLGALTLGARRRRAV